MIGPVDDQIEVGHQLGDQHCSVPAVLVWEQMQISEKEIRKFIKINCR